MNAIITQVAILSIVFPVSVQTVAQPNIIFILADDLGWDDISFHGSKQIPTPNIDTLATDGIILNNYYVQPICTPSRAALLTGRYPIHTGMQHSVIFGSQAYGLPLAEKLLPQYLKELGYATHMVGKWHLGFMSWDYTPTHRGFDSHFGILTGKTDYWDHTQRESGQWGLDLRSNKTLVKDKFGVYSTTLYTSQAEDIIKNHDTNKPLFMYLPHQAPHNGNWPDTLEAPWEYEKNFLYIQNKQRRKVAGMISALDDSVGNITAALHARGMLNNTIIAFSTDNGGPANGFSGNEACNQPLRGTKYTLWEGGVRGVGFVWSPLLHHSSYVSTHMMHITDWLPTLLHPAGYDVSKLPPDLDGMDLWPTLSLNEPKSPRTQMLHNIDPSTGEFSLRDGDMKLVFGKFSGLNGWYPVPGVDQVQSNDVVPVHEEAPSYLFKSKIKEIFEQIGRKPQFNVGVDPVVKCGPKPANASTNCNITKSACVYNITADPCEYYNLADVMPDVLARLMDLYRQYNDTMVPIMNQPDDPKGYPKYHGYAWTPWMNISHSTDVGNNPWLYAMDKTVEIL